MSTPYSHLVVRPINLSDTEVQEHTLIGKVLGNRYRVLREIGSGGMAWVYLAEDFKENQLVATKILYPQFGEDLSYIQRFRREAKLASTMTDPHIVRVLDYGADRDIHYIVMEYIEGQDLRTTLSNKGPFAWKNALELIDQLATALEHAYLHGIVHRDIKPQNMMLTDNGLLKVLDFGIARIPTLPSLTQSGFIGSPYYVSPEQAMGEEVDIRSDIYSSGIVLYELLSGSIPFDAKSPWSIISQHIANDPPPIDLPDGNIPSGVHQLLDRMVAKRPEDRFQTPTALRQGIAAVLGGELLPDHTLDTQPLISPDPIALAESLYRRAIEAMNAEEWGRAADLLSQTLNFDPNHSEARQKLILAEQEAFLLSLYNATKRALERRNWEEAINNLNGIIEIEPNYKDADRLLVQARRALEVEDVQQLVITYYNEGVAHFEAARWPSAIKAFQEVQRLSPGYEQVDDLLAEAHRRNQPSWNQKLTHKGTWWRWSLVILGVVGIFILTFFALGSRGPLVAEEDKQQLKVLYESAQQAMTANDKEQAVALLDQILAEDPDYADAAELKRELLATPTPTATPTFTPTPTATPTPSPTSTPTVAPTPTPIEDALAAMLNEVEEAISIELWPEAVGTLNEIRSIDPEYEQARIASLFCDAYAGRGLEILANIDGEDEATLVKTALVDFEAGMKECPRRTDLRDQAERATAYLEALATPSDQYDTLIETLTPIVAVEPDYARGSAQQLLYQAYLDRGDARRAASEIVGALSDYEAALALRVDDPSEAQTRRAELLLSANWQTIQLTPQVSPTVESEGGEGETITKPTSEPVIIKYAAPKLISPEEDTFFAGRLTDVFLEWEPVGKLADDEYYDLTIQYIFASDFVYWGTATKETRVKITPDIGLGRAGGDRFRWFVTVRKSDTSALSEQKIDLPVSPQSEIRSFMWVP